MPNIAYVDTSVLVAALFDEAEGPTARAVLARYERLVSSDLFVAELASVASRENVAIARLTRHVDSISLLFPNRSLRDEMIQILQHGYVRGADLWHLACALFLSPNVADLDFLTFDKRQQSVASKLGFPSPLG